MSRYLLPMLLPVFALFSASVSGAEQSFGGITCATDIPRALIGRHMPDERINTLEARYKKLGLQSLGAYGMENEGDPWTLTSWLICGREHLLLERRGLVRDVLASPLPPGSPPSQLASCEVDGEKRAGTAVVFVSGEGEKWPRRVDHAWLIKDAPPGFAKLEGKHVVCTP